MNVFEDLIVELKQENLLESTVIDDEMLSGSVSMEGPGNLFHSHSFVAEPTNGNGHASLVTDEDHFPAEVHEDVIDEITEEPVEKPVQVPAAAKPGKEFFKKRAVGEVSSLQMVEHIITAVEREYVKTVPATFDDLDSKRRFTPLFSRSIPISRPIRPRPNLP